MVYEELIDTVTQYRSPSKVLEQESFSRKVVGGGSGASRITFIVDDTTVVKIAASEMGTVQNAQEHHIWGNASQDGKEHLAEVYQIGPDEYWLEMERVTDPEATYKAIATKRERKVKERLEAAGITVPEIEVGIVDGIPVAYDYGACEL